MFGLALFKNEEYTLYLACAWARILEERTIYLTFTPFTMAYRTTNYFSICSLQMEHRLAASFSIGTKLYIVFSVYLGSHSLRTKNVHCIKRVFGLALFKNEEYTLYLACAWARILEERTIYVTFTLFTNGLPHD